MAVYVAKSTDASAPTLSGTAGDLTNLLDKCLCDGFGSYTAPGWAKEFTGTNKRVYRAPSGNRFRLRVSDEGTGSAAYARVVGYESMTDVDTGTNAFPTEAQFSGGLYMQKSSLANATTRAWYFFSNGTIFYLVVNFDGTDHAGMCFGDISSYVSGDAYNTVLMAADGQPAGNSYYGQKVWNAAGSPIANGLSGNYVARGYTQVAGAQLFSKVAPFQAASASVNNSPIGSNGSGVTYPTPASGALLVGRILAWDATIANGPRGRFPGIWAPGHNKPLSNGDTFTGAVGSDIAGRSFIAISPLCDSNGVKGQAFFETSDTWD